MKLFKNLLVGLLMLTATQSMAAKEVGNGGNAVQCPATNSAELLDYYEARILRNMTVKMGTGKDPVAVAQFTVQRLKKLSPIRALAYEKYIQKFMNESRFLKGVELVEVDDSGHIFLPNNCRIVQVALQKAPEFPGDGRYIINKDVWDQMPVSSQAGLILHEVIYREALEFNARDSRAVRYLNSVLAADQLGSYNPTSFAKLMSDIGFNAYDAFGTMLVVDPSDRLDIILDQSEFFKEARPKRVKITDYDFDTQVPGKIDRDASGNVLSVEGSFKFLYQGQNLLLTKLQMNKNYTIDYVRGVIAGDKVEFTFHGATYVFYNLILANSFVLHFNSEGALKAISGNFEITKGNLKTPGMLSALWGVELSEYGFPHTPLGSGRVYFSAPTKVKTDHGELIFKGGSKDFDILLYPTGQLMSGSLQGNQSFNGGVICPEGILVSMDKNGAINENTIKLDTVRNCFKHSYL